MSRYRAFLASEAAGGVLLVAAAALALLVANSPLAAGYQGWRHAALGPLSVEAWINDVAMSGFFLLIGLEIRRELVGGALADPAARRLPLVAAAGGMVVPALVYLAVTGGDPRFARGWAIPTATDIAFALGVLALLGRRMPLALKLFLTTLAIADDVGAVAIIALFYTARLDLLALAAALGTVSLMVALARRDIRALAPFFALAVVLWLLTFRSGIHPTIAGVAAALAMPGGGAVTRLEHALAPWTTFVVLPLFAFANAGVPLGAVAATPLVLAVAAGLFAGKQAGVLGAVLLAERTGLARRPAGITGRQLYGVALLAGIGFTMSLFVGALAFADPATLDQVRAGVLAGSLLSAVAGYAILRWPSAPAAGMVARCSASSPPPS